MDICNTAVVEYSRSLHRRQRQIVLRTAMAPPVWRGGHRLAVRVRSHGPLVRHVRRMMLGIDEPALPVDQESFMVLYEVTDHRNECFRAIGVHGMPRIVHQNEVAVG
jgi:hypothetical protein